MGVDDFVDGCFGTIGFLLLEARNGVEVTLTVPDLAFHLRGAVQLIPAASSADGTAGREKRAEVCIIIVKLILYGLRI